MADWTFDGSNKLIVEPNGSGNTTFQVDRDIYSAWKRWVESGAGTQYLPAFSVEGGTPIGATGLFTGSTFLLVNGWKVKPADFDHQVTLIGNLYSDDGVVSVPADTAAATVFASGSVAAQGIATEGGGSGGGTNPSEVWSYNVNGQTAAELIEQAAESAAQAVVDLVATNTNLTTAIDHARAANLQTKVRST
ncbi:MAG: hypothetical protein HRT63_11715 [Erythrobacter sp.]|nr:hypothetical protein [Erythrobacter sp.]